MEKLPEFQVTLTRLKPGEQAYPRGEGVPHYEVHGRRTKLGGEPDWMHGERANPPCPHCGKAMTFVAQIDSVEHDWSSNPHRVHALSRDQKWMFGDVGMIYVFFCFDCGQPFAKYTCG